MKVKRGTYKHFNISRNKCNEDNTVGEDGQGIIGFGNDRKKGDVVCYLVLSTWLTTTSEQMQPSVGKINSKHYLDATNLNK